MGLLLQDVIRAATGSSHRRLAAMMGATHLDRPRNYANFLRAQAEALFPLEQALIRGGIEALLPDWPQRSRSAALEHDLAAIDVAHDPLPTPQLESQAHMLGVTYVLEGSRMAARVILIRVAKDPGSELLGATSYIRHGFGRRLWPTFVEAMEGNKDARAHPDRVVQGAQLAFGMFESALVPISGIAAE